MPPSPSAPKKNGAPAEPRSLLRILRILETLARAKHGATLAELSETLHAPKSSLLLLLRPLVAHKYLQHSANRYELGPSAFQLSAEILSSAGISQIIRPYLEALAELSNESVYLAAIDREARQITYIEGIDSKQAVRYSTPIGTVRPLYTSSAGKVLLAFQEPGWQRAYLKTARLKPLTSKPLPDKATLLRELETIRAEGLAVSINEAVEGAAGIAAPLVKADGTATYALLIVAPSERLVKAMPQLLSELARTAASASETLRHMPGH